MLFFVNALLHENLEMSNSSDSEEFYDAEDVTPSHGSRYGGS